MVKNRKVKRFSRVLTTAALVAGVTAPLMEVYVVRQADQALKVYAETPYDDQVMKFVELNSKQFSSDASISQREYAPGVAKGNSIWITLTDDAGNITKYYKYVVTDQDVSSSSIKIYDYAALRDLLDSGSFKDATAANVTNDGGVKSGDIVAKYPESALTNYRTNLTTNILKEYDKANEFVYSVDSEYGAVAKHELYTGRNLPFYRTQTGVTIDKLFTKYTYGGDDFKGRDIWSLSSLGDFAEVEWKDGIEPQRQEAGASQTYDFRIYLTTASGAKDYLTDWETITVYGETAEDTAVRIPPASVYLGDWEYDWTYLSYGTASVEPTASFYRVTYEDTTPTLEPGGCTPYTGVSWKPLPSSTPPSSWDANAPT